MCAAHCKQSLTDYTAGAGSATLAEQPQVKNIESQLAHPKYNSRLIDYDYMLITIADRKRVKIVAFVHSFLMIIKGANNSPRIPPIRYDPYV